MLDQSTASALSAALVERALRAGADACDATCSGSMSEGVTIRLGELEDVERSESEEASLRVFVGQRSASISSTDLSDAALDDLATHAVAMARAAPEDRYAGLAPVELLTSPPFEDFDLFDETDVTPEDLRQSAEDVEESALAIAGVTNSEGASASRSEGIFALATSHGFQASRRGRHFGLSVSVIAGEGADKERDYAYRQTRHVEDLPSAAELGALAGERAVAKLGSGRMKGGRIPVILDPRVGSGLLSYLVSAINGAAIARRSSFLLGKLDEQVFAPGIRIVDDPHRQRGLRSRAFDAEGLPTARSNLVEDGRLTGWLMASAAARQLGLAPTGHASRSGSGSPSASASNVHLEPGSATPEELMADVAHGLYVTSLIGHGVNPVTGDYSQGAVGFRIENGERAGPVSELTVAGNLLDMFAALVPANDLEFKNSVNVPTIRMDCLTVAGQ